MFQTCNMLLTSRWPNMKPRSLTFQRMFLSILGAIFCFTFLIITLLRITKRSKDVRVCVLVLGDVGRSPRMQNHALSCARAGFQVDLIGFGGSNPIPEIIANNDIHLTLLGDFPGYLTRLPRLLYYTVKPVYQFVQLFTVLFVSASRSSHILVQNPPAIPSLAVAWVASLLCNCKFLIDWHNYGFTILAMGLAKPSHPLVRLAKWYEQGFGRLSDVNFCVTEAMKKDLLHNWQIRASTLYDRPPERFMSISIKKQHQLLMKLSKDYAVFGQRTSLAAFAEKVVDEVTSLTVKTTQGSIYKREDRPAFLVSSTSWTEDEDFSVLLDALEGYEKFVADGQNVLPNLICAITGKGPLKEFYQKEIANKEFKHVSICTPWLEPEDYPRLLGSADIGVCLHKSSSGLDLPMKVVDMFGCGLPVCAVHFKCLNELVKHEHNGLVFRDSKELTNQLKDLLTNFPKQQTKLKEFCENLKEFQQTRWEDSWQRVVLPVLVASR